MYQNNKDPNLMIGQGHVPSLDMVMMNLLLTLGSKDQQVGKKSRCYLSFFPLYIYKSSHWKIQECEESKG